MRYPVEIDGAGGRKPRFSLTTREYDGMRIAGAAHDLIPSSDWAKPRRFLLRSILLCDETTNDGGAAGPGSLSGPVDSASDTSCRPHVCDGSTSDRLVHAAAPALTHLAAAGRAGCHVRGVRPGDDDSIVHLGFAHRHRPACRCRGRFQAARASERSPTGGEARTAFPRGLTTLPSTRSGCQIARSESSGVWPGFVFSGPT